MYPPSSSFPPPHEDVGRLHRLNGELAERCRSLAQQLAASESQVKILTSLLDHHRRADTPLKKGVNTGVKDKQTDTPGVTEIKSSDPEQICAGWLKLLETRSNGSLAIFQSRPELVTRLSDVLAKRPGGGNMAERIDTASAPISTTLIYQLIAATFGQPHGQGADELGKLDLAGSSQVVLNNASALVAMSVLCRSPPWWSHPALSDRVSDLGHGTVKPSFFLLDSLLWDYDRISPGSNEPRLSPDFFFEAEDHLAARLSLSRGGLDGGSITLETNKISVIAGPVTFGKERIAVFHICSEGQQVTLFDTEKWSSAVVKLVSPLPSLDSVSHEVVESYKLKWLTVLQLFGDLVGSILESDWKASHPATDVAPTRTELVASWRFVCRQVVSHSTKQVAGTVTEQSRHFRRSPLTSSTPHPIALPHPRRPARKHRQQRYLLLS